MIKRIYLLSMMACLSLAASAITKTAVFTFNSAEAIEAWGLPVPTQNNPTALQWNLVVDKISLVPGSNSPTLTFYQGGYTFYSKNGQSFSFSAAEGATITRVDFNGMYDSQRFTANPAGFDANNTYWSGSASQVTFTGTGGNTLYSMTVTYEMEEQNYNPLDVNRDGSVTSSDITALYNYLLNSDMTYADSADVNGDGSITSADITVIYNYILSGEMPETVEPPTFSHPSGTVFNTPTEVTVTGPANSRVYITTDGSTPSTTHYQDNAYGSITVMVGFNMTLKAIAVVDGKSSAVATAVYSLVEVPGPTFNPPSGTVFQGTGSVTITGPYGSTIYFTLDGTTPTTSHYYTHGNSPYTIEELEVGTTTIKAIAVLNGVASPVMTAVYTVEELVDNNVNRNSLASRYNASKYMYRLEWPHIKDDGNQTWLAKSESEYGLALEMEWDNTKIANRFTCYYLDATNSAQNVGRKDSFKEDPEIPSSYRSKLSDYSGSGYARGHLCPSADRRASYDQQALTYYLSNMQPQWQKHNEAQWANLEGDVRIWAARCDTLYVVKAATIDDITLNGTTQSGVYSTTYNGTYYEDLKCNGRLLVAKYFYMALLAYNKSSNTYQAMGIWTKHYNEGTTGASGSGSYDWPVINKENAQYITIDELEQRTGIDFFCNLPDELEESVEATLNTTYWSSGAALNR